MEKQITITYTTEVFEDGENLLVPLPDFKDITEVSVETE